MCFISNLPDCPEKKWGPACTRDCNCMDSNAVCNKETGEGCPQCRTDYFGTACDKRK